MSKTKKIIAITSLALFFIAFVAVMVYYFGASYKQFDKISSANIVIPGLDTKFVPQGITYVQETDNFLISGYMSDSTPSRIYVVNKSSGDHIKYVTMSVDGSPYTLHAGGITTYQNYLYVAGDKVVVRFDLGMLELAEHQGEITAIDSFQTGNGCDFLVTYNNQLIVGEFYKKDKYETPTAHHITTNNQTNYALSYIYNFNPANQYGLESLTPTGAISMPNQVQGMTFTKSGDIFLSTSYSIPSSMLYTYENVLANPSEKTVTLNNTQVPLYILDSKVLKTSLKAPSMSEEAILVEDKVYLLFESNCKKYRFINRTRLSNVYALDI